MTSFSLSPLLSETLMVSFHLISRYLTQFNHLDIERVSGDGQAPLRGSPVDEGAEGPFPGTDTSTMGKAS